METGPFFALKFGFNRGFHFILKFIRISAKHVFLFSPDPFTHAADRFTSCVPSA